MPPLTVILEFNVLEDRGACRDLLGGAAFERRFPKAFQLLPRRWGVECMFSWFGM